MTQKQNREYWEKRTAEIFSELDKRDLMFFYEIQVIFSRYSKEIQKEIFVFYEEYAKENNITLQEAKRRAPIDVIKNYLRIIKDVTSEGYNNVDELDHQREKIENKQITLFDALVTAITIHLFKMGTELQKAFSNYLKGVIQYTSKKMKYKKYKNAMDKEAIKTILNNEWQGGNYSSRIWGNVDKLAKQLKKVLLKGFAKGLNATEMASELRKHFNVSRAQTETLLRTESGHVANLTTLRGYKEMGLTEYQFSAHLDNRTSKVCKSLNNQIFLIKDYQPGLNAPPMHPNCRSTIVPTDKEINSL
ncbi:minor capsid protein [Listeria kieliensis]